MKIVKIIFALMFLACLASMIMFIDTKSSMALLENRRLANPPRIRVSGKVDKRFVFSLPSQIDTYIGDRFWQRDNLITGINYFNYLVLHKSHSKRYLIGKDKWLFIIDKNSGDNFTDFKKQNLYSIADLRNAVERLAGMDTICRENGIKFFFVIAPNKHSVYPEQYPFPRPEGITRTDQLLYALPEDLRERIIFPRDYMISKKAEHTQPMYFTNGPHWNRLGAYYAFQQLFSKLKQNYPALPEIAYQFSIYQDRGMDSQAKPGLGLQKFGKFVELLNVEPADGWTTYYWYIKYQNTPNDLLNMDLPEKMKMGRYGIITQNRNPHLPRALVFRDSFFLDIEPFTSSVFSEVEYIWDEWEKRTMEYVLKQKPDVFIFEVSERALGMINFEN